MGTFTGTFAVILTDGVMGTVLFTTTGMSTGTVMATDMDTGTVLMGGMVELQVSDNRDYRCGYSSNTGAVTAIVQVLVRVHVQVQLLV